MHSSSVLSPVSSFFFFFNDTATTEIYTLSLHDALPIYADFSFTAIMLYPRALADMLRDWLEMYPEKVLLDRRSTRLNSSHLGISYAVFCLKKKKRSKTIIC